MVVIHFFISLPSRYFFFFFFARYSIVWQRLFKLREAVGIFSAFRKFYQHKQREVTDWCLERSVG